MHWNASWRGRRGYEGVGRGCARLAPALEADTAGRALILAIEHDESELGASMEKRLLQSSLHNSSIWSQM